MTTATKPRGAKNKGRRPDIEAELNKYGVTWEYMPGVSTKEFDIETSLKNQARFVSLDEGLVALYTEGVQRGDEFPAVVAYRPGRGRTNQLINVDGNHRLVAHDRAEVPIDVYEVDKATKAPLIALMTFSLNTKHGRPTSEQERLSQALYLMDNGSSMTVAASTLNLKLADLKRAASRAQGDKRADDVGLDRREWDSLSQSVRNRLVTITTDEGYHGGAHLAYAARLTSEEVFDLVGRLNVSRSAAKQRAQIRQETAQFAERIQDSGAGTFSSKPRGAMTPKARVMLVLGQALALPEDVGSMSRAFADAERGESAVRLMDASNRLRRLAVELDPDVK